MSVSPMKSATTTPMKKLLLGKHTPHKSLRIARAGGIPATAHINQHADKLKHLGTMRPNSPLSRRFATRPDTKRQRAIKNTITTFCHFDLSTTTRVMTHNHAPSSALHLPVSPTRQFGCP